MAFWGPAYTAVRSAVAGVGACAVDRMVLLAVAWLGAHLGSRESVLHVRVQDNETVRVSDLSPCRITSWGVVVQQHKFGKPQLPCFGVLLITIFHGI